MHRGSLIAGILSIVGAIGATSVVAASRNPLSTYSAIAVILFLNAAVRFRLARPNDDPRH